LWPLGLTQKPEYKSKNPPSALTQMVETNSSSLSIRSCSPTANSINQNPTYLTTAMLLGSQGCYLGQRIQSHLRERDEIEQNQRNTNTMSTSLFTIDSILAPNKPSSDINSKSDSPSSSPPASCTTSPTRPTRVPAMLHPGLHLGHLAAAAASSFGSPSDFLGNFF
jgi:homeobox protein goosecoid